MIQIQQVGRASNRWEKVCVLWEHKKVVFTQEVLFNNEKARIDKLENY